MILFKAWVDAQGCLADFALILRLMSVTPCSVTADTTVGTTTIGYGLRERPLFEPKRKLWILSSATSLCCVVSIQQPLLQLPCRSPAVLASLQHRHYTGYVHSLSLYQQCGKTLASTTSQNDVGTHSKGSSDQLQL